MDIILVHLGVSTPSYFVTCIEQIRKFTNDRIIIVLSNMSNNYFSVPDENLKEIYIVSVDHMEASDNWKKFKELNYFNAGQYGNLVLWNYACERLFVLEMVMKYMGIDRVLHIENDNLIYASPDTEFLESYCGKMIGITSVTETLLSAGIMYIGSYEYLCLLNKKLNGLMLMGVPALHEFYTKEMLHEMRLLKILYDENPGLIRLLPVFPSDITKYVYDCASWGQYVGGTFGNTDESFRCNAHIVGRKINQNKYDVKWIKENGKKLPYIIDNDNQKLQPVYNLHIHSKNLEKWVS